MKLIDLLVQELPKRGGWPDGVTHIGQDYDRELMFYGRGRAMTGIFLDKLAIDHRKLGGHGGAKITKDQYEYALAASQKPAWSGEGVPPVGCKCEFISNGTSWGKVKVIGFDGEKIVIRPSGEVYYAITPSNKDVFIPLRTEAERKRDEAAEAIDFYMPEFITDTPNEFYHAKKIYDAIAAGKIPGVKLDD
nr:MAG TPA: hypothetical protein [Bacteriophage sp.]